MEEGLLSLKWNNHKSTFFQVLSVLRQKLTFTDVTVACEGRLYPAHKFVLSACSEYFSDVFGSISGSNLVVVLKDVRRTDLEYLLDYMYLGQVDVAQSELSSLIKTAECLRIKGLAIPDDEPHKTRARSSEEQREGSPPAKKKRHIPADDERGSSSSLSGAGSSSVQAISRIHLDPLPPPPELNSLVQRLRQPSPHTQQATTTAPQPSTPQSTSKPHPAPLTLPHTSITSQGSTSSTSGSPTVSAPTLPVIKQEAADPSDAPDVFEGFEDGDTKPDVSDGAVAGPSGLQGSSDTWDGESDMGGFTGGGGGAGSSGGGGGAAGGEGYTEAGLEEQGDAEVQGKLESRSELEINLHRYKKQESFMISRWSPPSTLPSFQHDDIKAWEEWLMFELPDIDIKCGAVETQNPSPNVFVGFSDSEHTGDRRTEKNVNNESAELKEKDSTENENNRSPAHYDCQKEYPPVVGKQKENKAGEERKDSDMEMKEESEKKRKDNQEEIINRYEREREGDYEKNKQGSEKVQVENENETNENSEKACDDNEPEQEVVFESQRNVVSEEKREVIERKRKENWRLPLNEIGEFANSEKGSSLDEGKMTGQWKRTHREIISKSGAETSYADSADSIQKKIPGTEEVSEVITIRGRSSTEGKCPNGERISELYNPKFKIDNVERVPKLGVSSHKQIEITKRGEIFVTMDNINLAKIYENESTQNKDQAAPSREGKVNIRVVVEKKASENREERKEGDSDEKAKVHCEKRRKNYPEEEEQKYRKRKKTSIEEEEQQTERKREGDHKNEKQFTGQVQDNTGKVRKEGNEKESEEPEMRNGDPSEENGEGKMAQDDSDKREVHERQDIEEKKRENCDERSRELDNGELVYDNTKGHPAVDEYSHKYREGAEREEKTIKVSHGETESPCLPSSDNSDSTLTAEERKEGKGNFTNKTERKVSASQAVCHSMKSRSPQPKKKSSMTPQRSQGASSTLQQLDKSERRIDEGICFDGQHKMSSSSLPVGEVPTILKVVEVDAVLSKLPQKKEKYVQLLNIQRQRKIDSADSFPVQKGEVAKSEQLNISKSLIRKHPTASAMVNDCPSTSTAPSNTEESPFPQNIQCSESNKGTSLLKTSLSEVSTAIHWYHVLLKGRLFLLHKDVYMKLNQKVQMQVLNIFTQRSSQSSKSSPVGPSIVKVNIPSTRMHHNSSPAELNLLTQSDNTTSSQIVSYEYPNPDTSKSSSSILSESSPLEASEQSLAQTNLEVSKYKQHNVQNVLSNMPSSSPCNVISNITTPGKKDTHRNSRWTELSKVSEYHSKATWEKSHVQDAVQISEKPQGVEQAPQPFWKSVSSQRLSQKSLETTAAQPLPPTTFVVSQTPCVASTVMKSQRITASVNSHEKAPPNSHLHTSHSVSLAEKMLLPANREKEHLCELPAPVTARGGMVSQMPGVSSTSTKPQDIPAPQKIPEKSSPIIRAEDSHAISLREAVYLSQKVHISSLTSQKVNASSKTLLGNVKEMVKTCSFRVSQNTERLKVLDAHSVNSWEMQVPSQLSQETITPQKLVVKCKSSDHISQHKPISSQVAEEMEQPHKIICNSLKPQKIPTSSDTLEVTTPSKNVALTSVELQKTTSPSYLSATPVELLQLPSTSFVSQKIPISSHGTQEMEAPQDVTFNPVMSPKVSAKSPSTGVVSTLKASLQNPTVSNLMLDAITSGSSSVRGDLGVTGKSAECMEQTVVSEELHEATGKHEEGTLPLKVEVFADSGFINSFRGQSGVSEKSAMCKGQILNSSKLFQTPEKPNEETLSSMKEKRMSEPQQLTLDFEQAASLSKKKNQAANLEQYATSQKKLSEQNHSIHTETYYLKSPQMTPKIELPLVTPSMKQYQVTAPSVNQTRVTEEDYSSYMEKSSSTSNMNQTTGVTDGNQSSHSEKGCSEPKQLTPEIKQQAASANIEQNQTSLKKVSEQSHSPQTETNYLNSLHQTPQPEASSSMEQNLMPQKRLIGQNCGPHLEKRILDHQKSPKRKNPGESVSSPRNSRTKSSCIHETFSKSPSKSLKFSHEDSDSQKSCDEHSHHKITMDDFVMFDVKPCSVVLFRLLTCPCGDTFTNNTTFQKHLKSCKKTPAFNSEITTVHDTI